MKAIYGLLDSPKKGTKLTILSKEYAQDSEFCSLFGRTINCFQDLLTFMKTAFISRIIQLGNTDAQCSVADCTWQIKKRSMVNPTDFDILY